MARDALRASEFGEFRVLPEKVPGVFTPGTYREARVELRLPELCIPEADQRLLEYLAKEHSPLAMSRPLRDGESSSPWDRASTPSATLAAFLSSKPAGGRQPRS